MNKSHPEPETYKVSLISSTPTDPFRRLECNVVDIGHADKIITAECPDHAALVRANGEMAEREEMQRQISSDALILAGQAGKILEQMQRHWENGMPICAGSQLAKDFIAWGDRVMKGPLPSAAHAAAKERVAMLVEALKEIKNINEYAKVVNPSLTMIQSYEAASAALAHVAKEGEEK